MFSSSRWLILKGRDSEAYQSLLWLRGDDVKEGIEMEMDKIKREIHLRSIGEKVIVSEDLIFHTFSTLVCTITIVLPGWLVWS